MFARFAVGLALAACSSGTDSGAGTSPSTAGVETPPVEVTTEAVPTDRVTTEAAPDLPKDVRTQADGLIGDGVQPVGFTTVTARVTAASGEVCEVCLWLADDADERSRGLMEVTDLGDPVGLAFVWDEPTDSRFYMFQTPTPLSIAWFDAAGTYLGEADMAPCLDADSAGCDRYVPGGPFVTAIEVFQGELGAIGIGPGSTVELVAGTESPGCMRT